MNQLGVLLLDQKSDPGKDPLHLLLVEDDQPISAVLEAYLTACHYQVSTASDGQVGLAMAQQFPYDLIVLDVVLPGLDGLRFCQSLRSQGNQTPILLLTAKEDISDRVSGLNAGADDYMVKPFDLEELLARLRALLRRGKSADAGGDAVLVWDNLRLDPGSRTVWANQQPLTLTPKEYGLLELFLSLPNRVFSRSAILDRLWNLADAPGEETVSTHIKCLRQKLKTAGVADPIQTVHGVGYRLRPAPQLSSAEDTQPATAQPAAAADRSNQQKNTDQQKASDITARVWQHSQAQFLAQAKTIDQTVQALAQGHLMPELRQQGQQAAHKLAGSLGIFGLVTGSEAAHCLEVGLQQVEQNLDPISGQISGQITDWLQIAQLQRWVQILLQSLCHQTSSTSPIESAVWQQFSAVTTVLPLVRVLSSDRCLVAQLTAVALSWGLRLEVIEDAATLLADLRVDQAAAADRQPPQVALLDLDQLNWQESLRIAQTLPTVMLSSRNRLQERLTVTNCGGLYLQKPLLAAEILQALMQILRPATSAAQRLLVVDDDQTILHWLDALLRPRNVQVFGITDVHQVWSGLQTASPHLLILDNEMPDCNGYQICRLLRHD
ncbi:MAG: response regulator, partial [Elainella sp.]